jgi:hypothetical protein
MTVKIVHRGLLITAVAGGLMLASQLLASAATQPATTPTTASIVKTAPAVPSVPSGGAVDSGKGIVGGAVAGLTPDLGLPTL